MSKDAIIVLSHYLTPQRELTEESRLWVDTGLEIFAKGEANYIVMNGGPGRFSERTEQGLYVPRGTHPVHSEVMAQYAMQRGVPQEKIAIQDFSSDTVGESYFVKEMVLLANGFFKNIIVSSDYNMPRVEEIYKKILGDSFQTYYLGVPTTLADTHEEEARVRKSIETFRRQFGQVRDGDSATLEAVLYSVHDLYKDLPQELRWIKGISPVKRVGEL